MTTRKHKMKFGAGVLDTGEVRFNLWAPTARTVELCLEKDSGRRFILLSSDEEEGWYTLVTREAGAGTRYWYRVDNGLLVPDPASRWQPEDVHRASMVVDPGSFSWPDKSWEGRPWEEMIFYELHVGCFSQSGTFSGVVDHLDHLVELGVTAIEIMPVADFPGTRNWGYDGTLLFAPDSSYGTPDELKNLVAEAHSRGLAVLLDVVYNHFGPEGNYLHSYAEPFFTDRYHTPWGKAINFNEAQSYWTRQFFIDNALYWLEEFHLDGLRLDAVHAVYDASSTHILEELADAVRRGPGRQRHIHLVLENDNNEARYLGKTGKGTLLYNAQWNDDCHHALHVLLTGEENGYYRDYRDDPLSHLGRCLAEGFAYQGEKSSYRDGAPRGESSGHLPVTSFVNFLQNHDQVGNRAFGERIILLAEEHKLRAALAVLLLAPSPPLLFMGEEWGARTPFPFFCDFEEQLAKKVRAGRQREFSKFPDFNDPEQLERIPDPTAPDTFAAAALDWRESGFRQSRCWLQYYRSLLVVRHQHIIPRLNSLCPGGSWKKGDDGVLRVDWDFRDCARLRLMAHFGDDPVEVAIPAMQLLYSSHQYPGNVDSAVMPSWSVLWFLESG